MKKSLLFAFAAVSFCACTSDDSLGNSGVNEGDTNGAKIEIGVAQKASTSRGTGTVGGVVDPTGNAANDPYLLDNKWYGQTLNVFMFEKETLNYALDSDGTPIFDGDDMTAPETDGTITADAGTMENIAERADKAVKYYPTTGTYDFWGLHVDDAPNVADISANADNTQLLLDFTINGSQDIMTAKADPNVDLLQDPTATVDPERLYSAYSSRKGVRPELLFQHELARLTFSLEGANEAVCDAGDPTLGVQGHGVQVTGVVVRSAATGQIIVAYTPAGEPADGVRAVFGTEPADTADLSLMQRDATAANIYNAPLVALEPVFPEWDDVNDTAVETAIGEALLVAPSDSLEITIAMKQNVITDMTDPLNPGSEDKEFDYKTTLYYPSLAAFQTGTGYPGFEKGKSYNIKFKVYSLERIDIITNLTPWNYEGDIYVDEDA